MEGTKKYDLTIVSDYKESLIVDIKTKTGLLAYVGVSFEGVQLPCTAAANFNYNLFKTAKADFVFPKDIGTVTGESFALNEASVDSLWTAAKNFIEPILDAQRVLLNDVAVAETIAELDLIRDSL